MNTINESLYATTYLEDVGLPLFEPVLLYLLSIPNEPVGLYLPFWLLLLDDDDDDVYLI
jgi:hypothetical protein